MFFLEEEERKRRYFVPRSNLLSTSLIIRDTAVGTAAAINVALFRPLGFRISWRNPIEWRNVSLMPWNVSTTFSLFCFVLFFLCLFSYGIEFPSALPSLFKVEIQRLFSESKKKEKSFLLDPFQFSSPAMCRRPSTWGMLISSSAVFLLLFHFLGWASLNIQGESSEFWVYRFLMKYWVDGAVIPICSTADPPERKRRRPEVVD